MSHILEEWKRYLGLTVIPPFLFLCFHFLYHFEEMTVLKDAFLSFFFIELMLVSLAAITALPLAAVQVALKSEWFRKFIGLMTAFASLFIFLRFLTKWFLSFTLADEKGLIEITRNDVLLLSTALFVSVLIVARRKRLMPSLQSLMGPAVRRLAVLAFTTSLIGALALGYTFLKGGPSHAAERHVSTDANNPVNVLLIVIDTLSAKHLSCYGYKGNKTPTFDRLAEEGYFAENVRADITSTGPSISSLLSGRSPLQSHILSFEPVPGGSVSMNLLTQFERQGYKTESIVEAEYASIFSLGFPTPTEGEFKVDHDNLSNRTNWFLASLCKKLGFDLKFRVPSFRGMPPGPALSVFHIVLKHLDELAKDASRPYLLFAHYMLPRRFAYGDHAAEIAKLRYCDYYAPEKQPLVDEARTAYDRAVSELDNALNEFFQALEERGILKNTLVIITADHGDSYSRGFWGHGTDLSEPTIRVPLIILTPSKTRERISQPVQTCDIAPTILQLTGLKKPEWMDCISALDKDKRREKGVTFNLRTDRSIREKVPFPGLTAGRSIALYEKGFKFVEHPEEKGDELYDLEHDPEETTTATDKNPAKAESMKRALQNVLQKGAL